MLARNIFGVPRIEHRLPLAGPTHCNKCVAHFLRPWMQFRILDAEFAHLSAADFRAINLLGQPIMLRDHVALLE